MTFLNFLKPPLSIESLVSYAEATQNVPEGLQAAAWQTVLALACCHWLENNALLIHVSTGKDDYW